MQNTTNRFVAFIDILGFKNLVDNNSHEFVYKKLSALIESLNEIKKRKNDIIKIWTFSDSILIFTKDDSEVCADHILFETSSIIRKSISLELLAKGAVAFGEFTADYDNSIFFGKPLIDAFQLQEEMKLSSVIIHHSCEKKLKKMKYADTKLLDGGRSFNYNTPMKYGFVNHLQLNWIEYSIMYRLNEEERQKEFDLTLEKIDNLYLEVSGSPRQYLDNARAFLLECKNKSDQNHVKQK
jgi:hypothetical protein